MLEPMWLCDTSFASLFVLYKDLIHDVNDDYDISNPEKAVVINTTSFVETLFFQFMYLEGHLWLSPGGRNLTTDYFCVKHFTLIELCKRGVLTVWGACQPSYYEFVVVIHDDVSASFIEMLFEMSSLEIAIIARRLEGTTNVLCQYNFGEFPDMPALRVNKLDFLKECILPLENNVYHVTMFSNEYMVEDMLLRYWVPFNRTFGRLNGNIF